MNKKNRARKNEDVKVKEMNSSYEGKEVELEPEGNCTVKKSVCEGLGASQEKCRKKHLPKWYAITRRGPTIGYFQLSKAAEIVPGMF